MISNNQAAWMPTQGAPFVVGPAEITLPEHDEVLVSNKAWAINPIDSKMQRIGMFIKEYPTILGCDIAGEIVEVGSNVSKFKINDRVIAATTGAFSQKPAEQAFQLYTIVKASFVAPIPTNMPYEVAVKLPLAILTASAGLFETMHLSLPFPRTRPQPTGKTLIVWGGTSNVGSAAIQLAVAAGLEVVATASSRNLAIVQKMGGAKVFDYNSPTVVDNLIDYLKNKEVVGAYDAISTPSTMSALISVLEHFNGGYIAATVPPSISLPSNIRIDQVQALSVYFTDPGVGKAVWEDFVPLALENGQLQSYLETKVIGRGLENIQHGVNQVMTASSCKLVILA